MSNNSNLNKAKISRDDEFYTPYEAIADELAGYTDALKGKSVYCNCDDYRYSEFVHYFNNNFHRLELKKLVATGYSKAGNGTCYRYSGVETVTRELAGNGDFRSPECIELLKQADIVVTNPPFSLFREYIAQLMEYDKQFIILGPVNAISYKKIFTYIKENRLWIGRRGMNVRMPLTRPDDSDTYDEIKSGKKIKVLGNVCWLTNIKYKGRRCNPLPLFRSYNPEAYPKYDNYDAINVDRVADIPIDYPGVMGVPITFIDKYDKERFEIVGMGKDRLGKLAGVGDYDRQYDNPSLADGTVYYVKEGVAKVPYVRVLIRNKHPEEINYNFTRP